MISLGSAASAPLRASSPSPTFSVETASYPMGVGGNSTAGIRATPSTRRTRFKLDAREYVGCR